MNISSMITPSTTSLITSFTQHASGFGSVIQEISKEAFNSLYANLTLGNVLFCSTLSVASFAIGFYSGVTLVVSELKRKRERQENLISASKPVNQS